MRLQCCAGSLVSDMQQKPHRKRLSNHMSLSTRAPMIFMKPGPSQGQKPPFKLATPSRKDIFLKPAPSSLSNGEGKNQ